MTAAIHGLTFVEAGPVTHVRRYADGRPYWHCAATDGPCQGHGIPRRDPNACPRGHVGELRPRSDKPNAITCRGCERDRERLRASAPPAGPCPEGHTDTYSHFQPADGRWRTICRTCRAQRKAESRRRFNNRLRRPMDKAA